MEPGGEGLDPFGGNQTGSCRTKTAAGSGLSLVSSQPNSCSAVGADLVEMGGRRS